MRRNVFTARELIWGAISVLVFSLIVRPTPVLLAVLVFITGQAVGWATRKR